VPGSRASVGGDLTLLGVGPNQWLALLPPPSPPTGPVADESLPGGGRGRSVGGLCPVRDRRKGRLAPVAKGPPLDLAPAAFVPGMVAVSAIAHIPA
jgi:sarcosine oxidase subunit gamma